MIFHRLSPIVNWYYNSNILIRFSNKERKLYITFDDGPSENQTIPILNILKDYNAKATFFCKGENAEKNQNLVNQIIKEEHSIGNHTYSHLNGRKTENSIYLNDVEKCTAIIDSKLFRPPYGRIKKSQAKQLAKQYQIVFWSLITEDYNVNLSKEKCLKNAIKRTQNGDIVLFHDSDKASKNMLFALPRYLDYFSKKGFTFEKI